MAKNIDFMGATFPDVPSIRLPQHEGGLVSFDDTSDATATADKIFQGYTAYVNGQKLEGEYEETPSVEVEELSVTSNGTYTAPSGHAYSPVTVGVQGGGFNYGTVNAKTQVSEYITFESLQAEPIAFQVFLLEDQVTTSSSHGFIQTLDTITGYTYLVKFTNSTTAKASAAPIVFFGTKRIQWVYNGGSLTISISNTSAVGKFAPNKNYELVYYY